MTISIEGMKRSTNNIPGIDRAIQISEDLNCHDHEYLEKGMKSKRNRKNMEIKTVYESE
jgi:hypothetical protein